MPRLPKPPTIPMAATPAMAVAHPLWTFRVPTKMTATKTAAVERPQPRERPTTKTSSSWRTSTTTTPLPKPVTAVPAQTGAHRRAEAAKEEAEEEEEEQQQQQEEQDVMAAPSWYAPASVAFRSCTPLRALRPTEACPPRGPSVWSGPPFG
jgi:hypothetical protein